MPAKKVKQPPANTGASAAPERLEPILVMGEVVLHEGLTLIEVADAADLTSIQADSRLKDFILTRLSPTEALVLPQHNQAFLKALLKAGHTPKLG